jgi:FkbM family methyltransferase
MLPAAIRKLSCNPIVRGVASRLHVSHFARRVYCQLLSSSGELNVSCLGVNIVLKAHDSKQLAFMDYIITTEMGMIEAALSDLHAGDTFLDVGCHYGIFSIIASKLVGPTGRVISVEPHGESLQVFRENVTANNCKNVEILNVAFSDITAPLAFTHEANFGVVAPDADPNSAAHTVQGMAGDEALRNLPIPAAVKIDVEGHELAAMNGLKQTLSNATCRRLALEIHPTLLPSGVTPEIVKTFIHDRGFRILSEADRSNAVHVIAVR